MYFTAIIYRYLRYSTQAFNGNVHIPSNITPVKLAYKLTQWLNTLNSNINMAVQFYFFLV